MILLPPHSTHSVDIELFLRTARLRNSKLWMYPRVTTTQARKHPREFPLFLQTPMLCWVKIFSLPVSVPPPQHLTYCVLSRKSVPNLRVRWEEERIALHVPVFERKVRVKYSSCLSVDVRECQEIIFLYERSDIFGNSHASRSNLGLIRDNILALRTRTPLALRTRTPRTHTVHNSGMRLGLNFLKLDGLCSVPSCIKSLSTG